jgi:hypothetical protein
VSYELHSVVGSFRGTNPFDLRCPRCDISEAILAETKAQAVTVMAKAARHGNLGSERIGQIVYQIEQKNRNIAPKIPKTRRANAIVPGDITPKQKTSQECLADVLLWR